MPQTPILALPYPADTDPADVPTDMGELANRVEAVRGGLNGLAGLDASGKVPLAQLPAVNYATTLPASPVDGQEAILVDSLTNPSYQWRLRYNAGSSSPYKWEYLGGSPAIHYIGADETASLTNTWHNLATNGPLIVVARAGDYLVQAQTNQYISAGAGAVSDYLGVAPGDINPIAPFSWAVPAAINQAIPLTTFTKLLAVAASTAIKLRYFTNHATPTNVHYIERQIIVTPVRLS